jgi:hypothetical protein
MKPDQGGTGIIMAVGVVAVLCGLALIFYYYFTIGILLVIVGLATIASGEPSSSHEAALQGRNPSRLPSGNKAKGDHHVQHSDSR